MEALKIEKSTAKRLYHESPKWFQDVLSNTFGKEFFSQKITDRIKTFDDACREAGTTEEEFNKKWKELITDDTFNYEKIKLLAKVLNEGWEPDWENSDEYKWWPYFVWSADSRFDFSNSNYYYDRTRTNVGSRLCFKSKELSQYAGSQFLEIYRDFLTIKK